MKEAEDLDLVKKYLIFDLTVGKYYFNTGTHYKLVEIKEATFFNNEEEYTDFIVTNWIYAEERKPVFQIVEVLIAE